MTIEDPLLQGILSRRLDGCSALFEIKQEWTETVSCILPIRSLVILNIFTCTKEPTWKFLTGQKCHHKLTSTLPGQLDAWEVNFTYKYLLRIFFMQCGGWLNWTEQLKRNKVKDESVPDWIQTGKKASFNAFHENSYKYLQLPPTVRLTVWGVTHVGWMLLICYCKWLPFCPEEVMGYDRERDKTRSPGAWRSAWQDGRQWPHKLDNTDI